MTISPYSFKGNCGSHLMFQWESNASKNNILVAQYGLFPLGCYDHNYKQYDHDLVESH